MKQLFTKKLWLVLCNSILVTLSLLVNITSSAFADPSCQWSYYPIVGAKLQSEVPLFNDTTGTSLANISVGSTFKGKSNVLANTGSIDFDGDNKTDVFRTITRSDGNLQWQYSPGGASTWQNLAYDNPYNILGSLRFGNFNGNNNTDVFSFPYQTTPPPSGYKWQYSPGGTASYVQLSTDSVFSRDRVALGDFNGDNVTDVFTATQSGSSYQWAYSPNGTGSLQNLAMSSTNPSLLRFGDFNGDGKTDVFSGFQKNDGSYQWQYSDGGAGSYINIGSTTVPYSELQFGDFDGDGKTDVFAAQPQSDGTTQIIYWSGGTGSPILMGTIPTAISGLQVGDFNGDKIQDLMVLRCGLNGPVQFSSRQMLAQTGYQSYNNYITGDINNDGNQDVILVSTCQNASTFGSCTTNHLQVVAAIGSASHTYSVSAPQILGPSNINFNYYHVVPGDFNGDGKTDFAAIEANSTALTMYVALSNGDGTFTLGAPQVFNGNWNGYNVAVGDFNGDGISDVALTTICHFSDGGCSNGSSNTVYVALSNSTGVFNVGSRQDFGAPTGWDDYYLSVGDFNGDGKTDLLFNSTCQKTNFSDSTCTVGTANIIYTALANNLGGFTLSLKQTYGNSGWQNFSSLSGLTGDLNGDGRTDLIWVSYHQAGTTPTDNNQIVAGIAKADGTFQVGSIQDFGTLWSGRVSLVDLDNDGKADLFWNEPTSSYQGTDTDTYASALSNGDGTFRFLGQGSAYTGKGDFNLPDNYEYQKNLRSLSLVSTRQDAISSAIYILGSIVPTPTPTPTPTATPLPTNTPTATPLPTSTPTVAPTINPALQAAKDLIAQMKSAVGIAKRTLPAPPGGSVSKKKKIVILAQRKAILSARKLLKTDAAKLSALERASGPSVQTVVNAFTTKNLKTLQSAISTAIANNESHPVVAKRTWRQISSMILKLTTV